MKPLDVETLWTAIWNHPLRQRDIPIEAALSYPVPVVLGQRVLFRFFWYTIDVSAGPAVAKLRAPFARATVTREGRLVEYLHRAWADPFPGLPTEGLLGEARNPAMSSLTPKQITERRANLLRRYDALLAIYPRRPEGLEERTVVEDFGRDLFELVEAPFLAYYDSLCAGFLPWLRGYKEG